MNYYLAFVMHRKYCYAVSLLVSASHTDHLSNWNSQNEEVKAKTMTKEVSLYGEKYTWIELSKHDSNIK